jgi:hypothetical protein
VPTPRAYVARETSHASPPEPYRMTRIR